MATRRFSLFNGSLLQDTSGSVFLESINALNTNDRYPSLAWAFADTSTRILLRGSTRVPGDYVSAPRVGIVWATAATSGNARWEFDYTSIADGETADPNADQETVASTVACAGTARLLKFSLISLTAANLAPEDIMEWALARDGAEAGPLDTIAATCWVVQAFLEYSDT